MKWSCHVMPSLCPVPLSLNVNQMNYQLVFPTFIHVIQLYTISLEGQSKSLYICRIKFRCFIDFLFPNIRKAGSYQVLDDIIPYRYRKMFLGVCKTNGSGTSTRVWSAHERSPIDKKVWLSIHPRRFGNQVTVHKFPCVRTRGKPINVTLSS